jgi:hypothetical protein
VLDHQTPRSSEVAPPDKNSRRWLHRWPVLIPLLLVGGLLWISLWYSRRSQLLEDASHVEFDAPTWAWLEAFAGPEARTLIGCPTSVHLGGERPTTSQLRLISGMDELTEFAAGGMTDADLQYLTDCTKMESLQLHRSSITDAGVRSLARFDRLRHLTIKTDQRLTGEALTSLERMVELERVWIETPEMSEVSLAPFSSLSNLEGLVLFGAEIRGDTLKHLRKLPSLFRLALINCRLDVDSLAALEASLSRPSLGLSRSDITDDHLPALMRLNWLHEVWFIDTQVSDEACRRFKQARPEVEIRNARGEIVELPDGSY